MVRLAEAERALLTARVPRELSVAHSLVPMALPRLVLVAARLQSGEAVLGESMALPQLVAPRVALRASVRASLMAQQPSAPVVAVMESLSPMAKLWAQQIRSLPAGMTVPERLIAAPR